MKPDTSLMNRADFLAQDKTCWMHVCPLGEHPWVSADGKERIIQVIDELACQEMAKHYPISGPEARVDVDHKSMSAENTTEASGWGKQAEVRDNGLWVRAELTAVGLPLVQGKVYRFTSPCFPREGLQPLGGDRYRVTRIGVIALTNDPNLRGQQPLTNSRSHAANPNTKRNMDYKAELLKLLGLPPEATDDEITNGCATHKTQAAAMNSRITELGDLLANRDLDDHGITDVAQRQLLKPSLTNTATRPAALALLGNAKPKTATTQPAIHNRAGKPTPNVEALTQSGAEADRDKAAWIGNRARELQTSNPHRRHSDCFKQAESEFRQLPHKQ